MCIEYVVVRVALRWRPHFKKCIYYAAVVAIIVYLYFSSFFDVVVVFVILYSLILSIYTDRAPELEERGERKRQSRGTRLKRVEEYGVVSS